MARIRTIKPDFFIDDKIGSLSFEARLCFIGLWCLADDYGTINMHPLAIKGQLFPFNPEVDIEKCLEELEKLELIIRYGPNNRYIFIKNFLKHQQINRPSKHRQAPPPEEFGINPDNYETVSEDSLNTHGRLTENSLSTHGALTEHSVMEKEKEKEMEMEQEQEQEQEKEKKVCSANALHVLTTDAVRTPSESLQPPLEEQSLQNTSPPLKDDLPYKISACPYQEIVKLYHEILPELPTVKVLNETRKAYLRSRWREILSKPELLSIFVPEHEDMLMASERQKGLLWFRRYFEYVKESDFLCGRCEPGKGRASPFQADFEWLIRPTNFVKVLEGRYHQRASPLSQLSPKAQKTAIAAMNLIKKFEEEEKRKQGREYVVQ